MATYVLIHGAASDAWYWHRLAPLLRGRGHDVVAPDLPCEDDSATFSDYADVVVDAIGDRRKLVVVAQSLGGFTGPLVCDRISVDLLVLLNAMVPAPGESGEQWWHNTRHDEAFRATALRDGRNPNDELDLDIVFFHDVPEEVRDEAMARGAKDQSGTPLAEPWPLERWPEVPTRFIVARGDRLFPLDFLRRTATERLGIDPHEIDGGHLVALSRPQELVELLERLRLENDRATARAQHR
jgi:pimeloyl-ACP methyl ester carboxylesterase